MNTSLVGYTGFVGSNLVSSHPFSFCYNSKNISEAFGQNPDLLVFAGIRAEKYIANQEPDKDLQIVKEAFHNIKKISPKQLVLISTVDVYPVPSLVDEDSVICEERLSPYGYDRRLLEKWVLDAYPSALIVRLPGLFGQNLKKNFIFDLIRIIPSALTAQKYAELSLQSDLLADFYSPDGHGFLRCRPLTDQETALLKQEFLRLGFTALHFTDSRAQFQFYNLSHLWEHIQTALSHRISILNLSTEPLTVSEIYGYLMHTEFINEIPDRAIPSYDFRTKYAACFGGKDGYIYTKETVLNEIKQFVENNQ